MRLKFKMKINKLSTLVALAVLPLSAQAVVIDFSSLGLADAPNDITGFNWAPGNAYLYGYTSGSQTLTSPSNNSIAVNVYEYTMAWQTSLGTYETPTNTNYTGSLGVDHEVTLESSIDITIFEAVNPNSEFSNGFRLDNGTFNIYLDTAVNKNDSFGTGFNDGTLIISGSSDIPQPSTYFDLDEISDDVEYLDSNRSTLDYAIQGGYGIVYDVIDPNFIKDDITGMVGESNMFFEGTTLFTIDPIVEFYGVNGISTFPGTTNGDSLTDTSVRGTIFEMFSYQNLPSAPVVIEDPQDPKVTSIPEPSSLALLGLGLLGMLRKWKR